MEVHEVLGSFCLVFTVAWLAWLGQGQSVVLALTGRRRAAGRPLPLPPEPEREDGLGASVIIAARDEASAIGATLDDLLRSEPPPGGYEVIVVSDGSTDETAAIVRSRARVAPAGVAVRLVERPVSGGKERALIAGAAVAKGRILAFLDATTRWTPQTLVRLCAAIRPEQGIAAVSGRVCYLEGEGAVAAGFASYQAFVVAQRAAAGQPIPQVSTSGACSAVLARCFGRYSADINGDLQLALIASEYGMRAVYVTDALAFEVPRVGLGEEFRARRRIVRLNLLSLPLMVRRLWAVRAWQLLGLLFAVKVPRWLVAVPVLVTLLGLLLLYSPDHVAPVTPQQVLGVSAGIALVEAFRRSARLRRIAHRVVTGGGYFALAAFASAAALVRIATGERSLAWRPEREPVAGAGSEGGAG